MKTTFFFFFNYSIYTLSSSPRHRHFPVTLALRQNFSPNLLSFYLNKHAIHVCLCVTQGKKFGNSSKYNLCSGTHTGHGYQGLFLLNRNYVSESKHEILPFLYWNLMHFFWSSTQFEWLPKNSYFEPLYSAAGLGKILSQKWNLSAAEFMLQETVEFPNIKNFSKKIMTLYLIA